MTTLVDKNYEAYPFNFNTLTVQVLQNHPLRDAKIAQFHELLSHIIRHESFFTDYTRACDEGCGECNSCVAAKQSVIANLIDPKTIHWQVWSKNPETSEILDFVGILRLSNISPGCDATAHYFFFDGKLRDKTPLLKAWSRWTFSDHDNWKGLKRVTIEIPAHAFALARHANKKLGFGGPFDYRLKGSRIRVEGVKRDAVLKDGVWQDSLILGRLHNNG